MGLGLGGREPSVQGHHGAQQIAVNRKCRFSGKTDNEAGLCKVVLPSRAGKPYQRGTAAGLGLSPIKSLFFWSRFLKKALELEC